MLFVFEFLHEAYSPTGKVGITFTVQYNFLQLINAFLEKKNLIYIFYKKTRLSAARNYIVRWKNSRTPRTPQTMAMAGSRWQEAPTQRMRSGRSALHMVPAAAIPLLGVRGGAGPRPAKCCLKGSKSTCNRSTCCSLLGPRTNSFRNLNETHLEI